jgi:hypothetical protein
MPVSSRTTPNSTADRKRSQQPPAQSTNASDDGDRALAEIRAWTQLLVARGNHLREVAEREREALHGDAERPRQRQRAGMTAKPLA